MQQTAECRYLLGLLGRLIDANAKSKTTRGDYDTQAEALASKCALHGATAIHLASKPRLPIIQDAIPEVFSLCVVVRAAVEALLVFHHIFIASRDESVQKFRYLAWRLVSAELLSRHPSPSKEYQQFMARVEPQLQELRDKLAAHPRFQQQSKNRQKELLRGKRYPIKPWLRIAKDMGMGNLFPIQYEWLCSFAHSGYASVAQVRLVTGDKEARHTLGFAVGMLCSALAGMARAYASLYEKPRECLENDEKGKHLVEVWCDVGSGNV